MNQEKNSFEILVITDPTVTTDGFQLPADDLLICRDVSFEELSDMDSAPTENLILFLIRPDRVRKCIELIRGWKDQRPAAVIGVQLGASEIVRLMKAGLNEVFDYQEDRELIREWVNHHYEDYLTSQAGKREQVGRIPEERIVGSSPEIQRVRELAIQAAAYPELTVLVQGETGTGKEMVARLIHESSTRSKGPFVEVNCSAIPETLMEAEMLGHERGAFTDARKGKKGFFELADKGTLFLDEIGVMSSSLQNKILKIVEEKKFRRLGGEREIKVDVKIIAGTNEDLEIASKEGRFRPDLYYRLMVFNIDIPALRDRKPDIGILAEHFLNASRKRFNLMVSGFHPATRRLLEQYSWPGNVRELKHVIERACVLAGRGRLLPNQLPDVLQQQPLPDVRELVSELNERETMTIPLPIEGIELNELERMIMREVLRRSGGNQSKAARFLRISRTRLIRNLEK